MVHLCIKPTFANWNDNLQIAMNIMPHMMHDECWPLNRATFKMKKNPGQARALLFTYHNGNN